MRHFGALAFNVRYVSFDNHTHLPRFVFKAVGKWSRYVLSVFVRKASVKKTESLFDLLDKKQVVYVAVVLKLTFEIQT